MLTIYARTSSVTFGRAITTTRIGPSKAGGMAFSILKSGALPTVRGASTAFEVLRVIRIALSLVVGVLRIRAERSTASWERLAGRDY